MIYHYSTRITYSLACVAGTISLAKGALAVPHSSRGVRLSSLPSRSKGHVSTPPATQAIYSHVNHCNFKERSGQISVLKIYHVLASLYTNRVL